MLISKLILDEINLARTKPVEYAKKIEQYKGLFEKNFLKRPDGKKIETLEGKAAYEEAENFLKNSKPACPLIASKGLTKICEDILAVAQKCDAGAIDNNIDLQKTIKKYGSFEGSFGRLMEFGGEAPEHVVIDLIVSDGDKSRSQRNQLFDNKFKVVGLVAGDHHDFKKCTIIALATKFRYNADPNDVENY